jgi:hypothetical protein
VGADVRVVRWISGRCHAGLHQVAGAKTASSHRASVHLRPPQAALRAEGDAAHRGQRCALRARLRREGCHPPCIGASAARSPHLRHLRLIPVPASAPSAADPRPPASPHLRHLRNLRLIPVSPHLRICGLSLPSPLSAPSAPSAAHFLLPASASSASSAAAARVLQSSLRRWLHASSAFRFRTTLSACGHCGCLPGRTVGPMTHGLIPRRNPRIV